MVSKEQVLLAAADENDQKIKDLEVDLQTKISELERTTQRCEEIEKDISQALEKVSNLESINVRLEQILKDETEKYEAELHEMKAHIDDLTKKVCLFYLRMFYRVYFF